MAAVLLWTLAETRLGTTTKDLYKTKISQLPLTPNEMRKKRSQDMCLGYNVYYVAAASFFGVGSYLLEFLF